MIIQTYLVRGMMINSSVIKGVARMFMIVKMEYLLPNSILARWRIVVMSNDIAAGTNRSVQDERLEILLRSCALCPNGLYYRAAQALRVTHASRV